jgi:hypothetical protein
VATGIEAEQIAHMPDNVEQLRPRARAAQLGANPELRAAANPVRSQMDVLAQEMNASIAPRQSISPVEPIILGTPEVRAIDDEEIPMPEPVRIQPLPRAAEARPAAEPQEEKKRRFGFLGRRRAEPVRAEPQMASGSQHGQRASTQVITREVLGSRPAAPSQANAEDLFPDFKKDDRFEIPAFLRRQTN